MSKKFLWLLAVVALVAAACGSDSADDAGSDETTTSTDTTTTTEAEPADDETADEMTDDEMADDEMADGGEMSSCDAVKTPGSLTVATGDPVFPPWMEDDDPSNGQGFESAVVYAVADELGFDVQWVRTTFDQGIAPGEKDYDFNVQQYSITEARDEVVDFSDPYYVTRQALVAFPESELATATTVEDLRGAKLGAAIGTTSLDFIEDIIQPDTEPNVYDENVDVEAAMNAGQIDGLVVDLPTAYFVIAVQVEGAIIAGQFEAEAAAPDEFGLLFADGNPLVTCVNAALATLRDDGTLQDLEDQWLSQEGAIPVITG